ncbi:MAG: hypothetical protein IT204_01500 [Fimbriimonadaceae bacterium]|nr:hypothetical protein [Fimbriimonadaceae bacterium]
MRVTQLLVEGRRDRALLAAVLRTTGVHVEHVVDGRTRLPQRVIYQQSLGVAAKCLRDRDFDFAVPGAGLGPWTVSGFGPGPVLVGWFWRRFELENYLLDPTIQAAACGRLRWWDEAAYRTALTAACHERRYHVAARQTLVTLRTKLPPGYLLSDRPPEWEESWIDAPPTAAEAQTAVDRAVARYAEAVASGTDRTLVGADWGRAAEAVDTVDWDDAEQALVHFPGKDLAQALGSWLRERGESPERLLDRASTWIQDHPAEALSLLRDWQLLVHTLSPEPAP